MASVDPFSAQELADMQGEQTRHMSDVCILQALSLGAADSYGRPAATYNDGSTFACGLDDTRREEGLDDAQVEIIDATIRLPIGALSEALSTSRIKVTHRHGSALSSPIVYKIIGPVRRGPSGLVADCQHIEG